MRLQVGKDIDNYIDKLSNLEFGTLRFSADVNYDLLHRANIVADAIKANIKEMPVDDTRHAEKLNGIRSVQKEGLLYSFGIARLKDDNGFYNVKVGFDGYNKLKTKKYPQGQPNAMIARTFESGNSFTKKQPFIAPAVRATKDIAEAKMAQVIDEETSKIMNN